MAEIQQRSPAVIHAGFGQRDLAAYIATHRTDVGALLLATGAIVFRGFSVGEMAAFQAITHALDAQSMDYVYRSTPRTHVASGVFTATEYPPSEEIPLHSENAYQRSWPRRLLFWCRRPASAGGETTLADLRAVTAALPQDLLEQLEDRGVAYVRHYHAGFDLPWTEVFQVQDKPALAAVCTNRGIEHRWLEDGVLRTFQRCQGIARHPSTGERVFFNQAHLFHASALGEEVHQTLVASFGLDRLPRHALYGDETEIPAEQLEAIRGVMRKHEQHITWRAGDVALLDNMQMLHGRRPFAGRREVYAALLDPHPSSPEAPAANAGAATLGWT